jgi:hypothetical protein
VTIPFDRLPEFHRDKGQQADAKGQEPMLGIKWRHFENSLNWGRKDDCRLKTHGCHDAKQQRFVRQKSKGENRAIVASAIEGMGQLGENKNGKRQGAGAV